MNYVLHPKEEVNFVLTLIIQSGTIVSIVSVT